MAEGDVGASPRQGFFTTAGASVPWDGDESKYACEWDATVAWLQSGGTVTSSNHDNNSHSHTEGGAHRHSAHPLGSSSSPTSGSNLAMDASSAPNGGPGSGLTGEQKVRIKAKREEALAKKRRLQGETLSPPIASPFKTIFFSHRRSKKRHLCNHTLPCFLQLSFGTCRGVRADALSSMWA
jgi:hypothetical protein